MKEKRVLTGMRTLLLLFVVSLIGATASAQPAPPPAAVRGDLPVSLDRIKRQLGETSTKETSATAGLRLNYYLDVYGRMPAPELFKDFNLEVGPVPYGGPTHTEFLQLVTPQEFRSPPANLTNVAQAFAQWLAKRAAEKKARRGSGGYSPGH